MNEFKDFILRGNVVDLAVAVVVGTAFNAVVTSLVGNVFTPLLSVLGLPDFSRASFPVGKAVVQYGKFLNALISFLVIAGVVFFLVVKPVQRLMAVGKPQTKPQPATKDCRYCLSSVPEAASRCPFCTSVLEPSSA